MELLKLIKYIYFNEATSGNTLNCYSCGEVNPSTGLRLPASRPPLPHAKSAANVATNATAFYSFYNITSTWQRLLLYIRPLWRNSSPKTNFPNNLKRSDYLVGGLLRTLPAEPPVCRHVEASQGQQDTKTARAVPLISQPLAKIPRAVICGWGPVQQKLLKTWLVVQMSQRPAFLRQDGWFISIDLLIQVWCYAWGTCR